MSCTSIECTQCSWATHGSEAFEHDYCLACGADVSGVIWDEEPSAFEEPEPEPAD